MARKTSLIVEYSEKARQDMREIWLWNAGHYDADHADRYTAFLKRNIDAIGNAPQSGIFISRKSAMRRIIIRRRTKNHGHIAFYITAAGEVRIIRILHTSQNWQTIMKREQRFQ